MATYRTIVIFVLTTMALFANAERKLSNTETNSSDELHYPAPILQMDDYYNHHVIVVEKSTHQLFLFEKTSNGIPRLIKTYQIVTGKKSGNKSNQGDFRTPEGVYYFTDFISNSELLSRFGKQAEIYGAGAFVLNYPNPIDNQDKKGGSGIWLHSTNDETRIEKGLDSRGCVVVANNDLKELSEFLETDKMSIIIVQDLHFSKKDTWETNKDGINKTLNNWVSAWKNKDIETYLSYYDPINFKDPVRGTYPRFKQYKKAVFSNPGNPEIELNDISILQSDSYAVVTFTQKYKSNTINDTGKKLLYMKKDNSYEWKIIAEIWARLPQGDRSLFVPSQRFFKKNP